MYSISIYYYTNIFFYWQIIEYKEKYKEILENIKSSSLLPSVEYV